MSDVVGNPEDRFSHNEAHKKSYSAQVEVGSVFDKCSSWIAYVDM